MLHVVGANTDDLVGTFDRNAICNLRQRQPGFAAGPRRRGSRAFERLRAGRDQVQRGLWQFGCGDAEVDHLVVQPDTDARNTGTSKSEKSHIIAHYLVQMSSAEGGVRQESVSWCR